MKRLISMAVAAACLGLALAGCSTIADRAREEKLDAARIQAMLAPTVKVKCPTGCAGLEVEYHDPHKPMPKHATNAADAAIAISQSVERIVTGAVPMVAIGATAYHGFKAIQAAGAGGDITTTTTTNSTNQTTTTETNTTTTSTETNTTLTAGDGSSVAVGDATNTRTDSTHTPTVVLQPPPVVVMQPPPVVVVP